MGIAADMNPGLRMHKAILQQHQCISFHSNKHCEGWNNLRGNCGGDIDMHRHISGDRDYGSVMSAVAIRMHEKVQE